MKVNFVILPDSTCDLNAAIRKDFSIDFIGAHYTSPDGKERECMLDWQKEGLEKEKFYKDLRSRPNDYSTAPPSPAEFAAAIEKYYREGKGVLILTISSALSGTYNFAKKGADDFVAAHPDARVRVVDSLRYSVAMGLMSVYASLMREQEKTLDETADWLEANKNRFHQAGWLDDLSFVAKKGRLNHAKAFFGTLAGIKPVGELDNNGLTTVLGKAKGEKQAYRVFLGYMEKTIEKPEENIILIADSNRNKQALAYRDMIEEKFHPKAIYMTDVFSSSGINVGPGLMAAYYFGKPISDGLEEEKRIVTELLAQK